MKHAGVLAIGVAVGSLALGTQRAAAEESTGPLRPGGVALAETPAPVRLVVGRAGLPSYRVAPPEAPAGRPKAAVFSIRYLNPGEANNFGDVCVGWPEASKAAFSYAANAWSALVNSEVPIVVSACWANMGTGGILGHGGARTFYRDFAGAPEAGTYFPVAVANALAGQDLNGGTEEMVLAYNNQFSRWYFGADGLCPGDQIDFAQVVMHEMCHGLGFQGSMEVYSGLATYGMEADNRPLLYDRYAVTGGGQPLLAYPSPCSILAGLLTGGSIYFAGPRATAANGGVWAKLYAPGTWKPGSSYVHLDEVYNGTPNGLMTYAVDYGESIHHPGPVTIGLLQDVGWPLGLPPRPAIYANGQAPGEVVISTRDVLQVTVALDPGADAGQVRDWWLAADTTYGIFAYNAATGGWEGVPNLAALPETVALDVEGLAPGAFQFYFGVDAPNGVVDADLVYATVRVTVQ